jgi:hypothetical protein
MEGLSLRSEVAKGGSEISAISKLGQTPMLLVFLTPRQALSSHQRQQIVGYRIEIVCLIPFIIRPYLLRSRRVFPGLPSRFSSKKLEGLSLRSDVATGGGEISAISKFCPG